MLRDAHARGCAAALTKIGSPLIPPVAESAANAGWHLPQMRMPKMPIGGLGALALGAGAAMGINHAVNKPRRDPLVYGDMGGGVLQ